MLRPGSGALRRAAGRMLPVTSWTRSYSGETAAADLVAGVTVALTLIPQSIAYAALAGLQPQYGLYSSFAGSLVYIVFGTVPEINIGPTALLSLLTFAYTAGTNADFAVLLCFLGGFVQLLVGFSRLGFLVDFVSMPVVSGFTSAAALIITCSQFKSMLGLTFKAESFLGVWTGVISHITHVRLGDTLLGVICITILLAMRQMKNLKFNKNESEPGKKSQHIAERVIWFLSVGRNAIIVIGCSVVAYIMDVYNSHSIILTGDIQSGLPEIRIPNMNTTVGNETYTFNRMTQHLGSGILVVPLIGIIANVAIAKAFAKGKILDANQEIIALGLCNIVSSFAQSIPVNGSFSRSAVSNSSGVRTPAAGLYTGIIVLMTLGFLTPYFYYIPRATLASVIICAVIFMIDLTIIKDLWKSSKIDLIPLFGTFFASLFLKVEFGILVGIGIDVIILLFFNARPRLNIEDTKLCSNSQYILVTPSGGLFFPSANFVREKLSKAGKNTTNITGQRVLPTVVINCINIQRTDWTSLQGLKALVNECQNNNKTIIFMNCRPSLKEKLQAELKDNFKHCSTEEELRQTFSDSTNNRSLNEMPEIKVIQSGEDSSSSSAATASTKL